MFQEGLRKTTTSSARITTHQDTSQQCRQLYSDDRHYWTRRSWIANTNLIELPRVSHHIKTRYTSAFEIFWLSSRPDSNCGHQASDTKGTGGSSPAGGKETEVRHSPTYNANVKNMWRFNSILPFVIMASCSNTHSCTFQAETLAHAECSGYQEQGSVGHVGQHFQLTPRSGVRLDNVTIAQLVKKFCAFNTTWRRIIVFTRSSHWALFWARWIQSIPFHPIFSDQF
jgi:hypothetical protein